MNVGSRPCNLYEEVPYHPYGKTEEYESEQKVQPEIDPIDINIPFGWME
jgi:hypothetical protein